MQGRTITGKTAHPDSHRPSADDAKASLRAELLVPLVAGQFALEAALADTAGADPAIRNRLSSQLSLIAGLRQQITTAQSGSLTALRAEAATLASSATAAAQDARTGAAAASGSAATTAALAVAAREQVTTVMAGMKDFDRYLRFGPGDNEAEYRQREAERRALIAAEQAKGTLQGDLNASGAAVGQMVDAKAHGAGDSPEFQKRWEALVETTDRLRAAAKADGISTEEFDRHLREDLRRILKSKGLTDAQINAQFAAHADPLTAAKAYVAGDTADLDKLRRSAERIDAIAKTTDTAHLADVRDLIASMQTTGIVAQPHDPSVPPEHGVAAARSTASGRTIA